MGHARCFGRLRGRGDGQRGVRMARGARSGVPGSHGPRQATDISRRAARFADSAGDVIKSSLMQQPSSQ